MRIVKTITILLFPCLLIGCKSYFIAKHKLNRPFKFISKEQYQTAIIKEMNFPDYVFLYADTATYKNLWQLFSGDEIGIYLGTFLNDSVSIKKSDFLKEFESCIGRMETEINGILLKKDYPPGSLDSSLNFHNIKLYNLKGNIPADIFNSNGKIKIMLLYSYKLGTYYKKLYREIIDAYQNEMHQADLYIISFDKVAQLKDK